MSTEPTTLSTDEDQTPTAACCSTARQSTCCDASEKTACCGTATGGSCGCQ